MRYDSEPQIVRRILTETGAFTDFLKRPELSGTIVQPYAEQLESHVNLLRDTLDHFSKLHTLNPQFSLSRFSASYIEQKLQAVQSAISAFFEQKTFDDSYQRMDWYRVRFAEKTRVIDHDQILISLYKRIEQVLETYNVDRIRQFHIAAVLNECVGWSEHIEQQGHHDIHGVILFAQKVARDNAIIEHRTEFVRDVCLLLEERTFFQNSTPNTPDATALELSRVYSPYLLELYEAILEDMEIIPMAHQDYRAFQRYCQEHDIDVYEEYHDILTAHIRKYVELMSADISSMLQIVSIANIIVNAESIHKRYADVNTPLEILGENLARDIREIERAIRELTPLYPDMIEAYEATLHKITQFKGAIMRPAIEVYGKYLEDPADFFRQLPYNLSKWIPILDSALACLEQDDELYQKCSRLKAEMDNFVQKNKSFKLV